MTTSTKIHVAFIKTLKKHWNCVLAKGEIFKVSFILEKCLKLKGIFKSTKATSKPCRKSTDQDYRKEF